MKPTDMILKTLYRVIDRETGEIQTPNGGCDQYFFTIEGARGLFTNKEKYKISKFTITEVLRIDECD